MEFRSFKTILWLKPKWSSTSFGPLIFLVPKNLAPRKFGLRKIWNPQKLRFAVCAQQNGQKVRKKVANYQKFICIKVTSYKTHILVRFGKIKKCWPPKK